MAVNFYVGIDISNKTLDFAVVSQGLLLQSFKINNSTADIAALLKTLRLLYKITPRNTIFCAENMGLYANFLIAILEKKKYPLCLENALRIKRSLGIQRGKDDALDAIRIARYAYTNRLQLSKYEPPRQIIMDLKLLIAVRNRLIKAKIILLNNKKQADGFLSSAQAKIIFNQYKLSVAAINTDIEKIEETKLQMIRNDPRLNNLHTLITSVPRIGNAIAIELIVCTNEFKSFQNAKKFCSYCGIAPFQFSSGTSLKGRPRVSHIANKHIKKLLHLAALGFAKKGTGFLFLYYARKVKEGKNKMSILNAIRNKLVIRIFSCVLKGKIYQE